MSDDEVCSLMDRYEAMEKGYDDEFDEGKLPHHIAHVKCECSAELVVVHVDCETRGDCEIYVCECKNPACDKETSMCYAEEWYE